MDAAELNDVVQFLTESSCFSQAERPLIERAAQGVQITYQRDKTQLDKSTLDNHLWIVRSGAVATMDDKGELLSHVGEGDFFGTDSVLDDHFACDHASLIEDTLFYKIPADFFNQLCQQSKELFSFCKKNAADSVHTILAERADTLALTHTLGQLIKRKLISADVSTSIQATASLMAEHKVSCIPIIREGKLAGIITDRDLRSRVVAVACDIQQAVDTIMTPDPLTLNTNDYVFEALMLMSRYNIHHLPVEENNQLVGLVTVTDLIRIQRNQPVFLIGEIWKAESSDELTNVCQQLPTLFMRLIEAEASALEVSRLLTTFLDAVTQRLLQLFHQKNGDTPIPYAWMAFGSQAREDLSVSSDQDNGLILDDRFNSEEHDAYFKSMAKYVSDGLAQCGFRYCPGEIMATTDKWRKPLAEWKQQFSRWINEPEEKAVMHCSIFFDQRCVAGEHSLAQKLQEHILSLSGKNGIFLAYMTKNALTHRPPLGVFRGLVVEGSGEHKNELDLKHGGTIPVTDIARQYALANGVSEVNTMQRLARLAELGILNQQDIASLTDAYEFMAQLRFKFQAEEIRHERDPDNYIPPTRLSPLEKHYLKLVFKTVKSSQESMATTFLGNSMR